MENLQSAPNHFQTFIDAMWKFKTEFPERAVKMIQDALEFRDIEGFVAYLLKNPSISFNKEELAKIELGLKQLIFEIPTPPETISTPNGIRLQKKLLEIQKQSLNFPEILSNEKEKILQDIKIELSEKGISLSEEEIAYLLENLEAMAQRMETPTTNEASQVSNQTGEVLKTA